MRLTIDPESDENGIRSVSLDPNSFNLPPAPVPIAGFTACITAAGEGVGFIDCDGGLAGIDSTLAQDHNLNPGSGGNSGAVASGFADDASCNTPILTPQGALDYPCLEGTNHCDGGTNDDLVCGDDDDCPGGGTCSPCSNSGNHAGICNSPVRTTITGTFAAGDMLIVMPLAITQLANSEFGPDNLPCTADDTPATPPAAVPVALSTGVNSIRVFDANNNATLRVAPGSQCGFAPCIAQTQGTPLSCAALDASSDLSGTAIGGGFPALDIAVINDMATTFKFVIE